MNLGELGLGNITNTGQPKNKTLDNVKDIDEEEELDFNNIYIFKIIN